MYANKNYSFDNTREDVDKRFPMVIDKNKLRISYSIFYCSAHHFLLSVFNLKYLYLKRIYQNYFQNKAVNQYSELILSQVNGIKPRTSVSNLRTP